MRAGWKAVGRVVPALEAGRRVVSVLWRVSLLPQDLTSLTSVIELVSARGTQGNPGARPHPLAHCGLFPLRASICHWSSSCHAVAPPVKAAVTAWGAGMA